jgi:hypothetical protein
MQPMAQQPAKQQQQQQQQGQQQQPLVGVSRILKLIPDRTLTKSLRTQKLSPRPPYEFKAKMYP